MVTYNGQKVKLSIIRGLRNTKGRPEKALAKKTCWKGMRGYLASRPPSAGGHSRIFNNHLQRWFDKPVLILPRKDEGLTTNGGRFHDGCVITEVSCPECP